MLWKAFTPLIFFVMLWDQGTSGSDMKTISVPVIMGSPIKLQPIGIQKPSENIEFIWSVKLSSTQEKFKILSRTDASNGIFGRGQFKNRVKVETENLILLINSAQKNDSGLYFMEITRESGQVFKTPYFQVSVFDPVQDPSIQVTGKSWNNSLCHVNLSCFVHGNDNLTYTWYRGREQIKPPGKQAHVQLHIQAKNTESDYTCNVSNPVSSGSHTINLARECASPFYGSTGELWLPLVLAFSMIPLVILFLSTIVCLYVSRKRKRRRKQVADMNATSYKKIGCCKPKRNKVQNFCGAEKRNTFYSVVQLPEQQPSSKQMKPNSSQSVTIYQEVQRPNRLSCKELEMFRVYS